MGGDALRPCLGVILVGDDPASHLYVSLKERMAKRIGIRVEKRVFLEGADRSLIEDVIDRWNADENVHSILVQLPLPENFPTDDIVARISPEKDADGFHPENEKRFFRGEWAPEPVFPRALLELIRASGEELSGKRAIVVGNSYRFGDMMCRMLARHEIDAKHIPCIECVSPQGLSEIKKADILVSACGKPGMIVGGMLKSGAIVVDGGIVKDGVRVLGDVDRSSVESVDISLSPVPGGVGPVTIACLLANVVEAAKRRKAGSA